MKKTILSIIGGLVAVVAVAVLLMRPVKVLSENEYQYKIFITLCEYSIEGIADYQGGARCYLDDEHYVWVSYSDAEQVTEEGQMYIKFGLPWQKTIINKGGR